jgi:hypothetical protein
MRWILAILLASTVAAAAGGSRVERAEPAQVALKDKDEVAEAAQEVFLALLAGDAQAVTDRSALPFVLENRTYRESEALLEEWVRQLGARRTDLLVLHGIEVLTPEEMETRFGAPPARLESFPWRSRGSLIAVGNLSGRAAVAVFRAVKKGEWRLIAYHD